ncbi:hypothetical protein H072_10788 [Dactylellina haptotyla CBS 200.50]|uniref:Actin cytoskeleton-regulatory complex protein PAN1 n=1 Tax=Dactylellina haptotyla (strain CBS 200.50) TaxID=1284197 RepID=S7ZYP3_DACHA|nr:hypothetical protein H072_10788 [Dactylellina haptotyla CBS 200.50]
MYGNPGQFGQQPNQQQQQQFGQGQYGQPQQQQYGGGLGVPGQLGPQATGYPGGFMPQPTGYGVQPMPLNSQYTGFIPQPTGAPGVPGGFGNIPPVPQVASQFQQQQGPLSPQTPTQASQPKSAPASAKKAQVKIPNIRLTFITAADQAKFEQLFKAGVQDGQALSGNTAKEILLRSGLPGSTLETIWGLSDTTKSGHLMFPEFAVAMWLCNVARSGQSLPSSLPERILNEVSSMVDIISFAVPDVVPDQPIRTNVPKFDSSSAIPTPPPQPERSITISPPAQPQPQQSNFAALAQLQTGISSQPTGLPAQPSGFQPSQGLAQSLGVPSINLHSQVTGFQGGSIGRAAGSNFLNPSVPAIPSQFTSSLGPGSTLSSLQSQPTGRPGQWGFVNAPAGGLPGIEALGARMMPNAGGHQGGFTTTGLTGNAKVPWAITKDEKSIYDNIFSAWDGLRKGFIAGSQAIEIFSQSGVDGSDLERIWTLSDPGNKGRLDRDEFAVAMHLIYRKLQGNDVPARLPPELIPPSTRGFTDSVNTVKNFLKADAEVRRTSGANLLPQATGVSMLKNRSFRASPVPENRKDATLFRNNDDDVGYQSSARRRVREGGRTPSPAPPTEELTVEQLRKKVREKQILLDAIDIKDEDQNEEDAFMDRRDRRDADDLYRRIRRVQEDIDAHPNAGVRSADAGTEKRALKRQLQNLTDRLPDLASKIRKAERSIMDAKLELFRLKDAKAFPDSSAHIIGTGPGGTITESDRSKARARAKMQARMAELTGRPAPGGSSGGGEEEAARRLADETNRARDEKDRFERMIRDIEETSEELKTSVDDTLRGSDGAETSSSSEHEKRRWEEGLGVEEEVRDFIYELERSSKLNRGSRRDDDRRPTPKYAIDDRSPARDASPPSRSATPKASDYSRGAPATEDRAARIKRQAEERMAAQMAKFGITRSGSPAETTGQRLEREKREREEKRRMADDEAAKREDERQKKLQADFGPPVVEAKKPPPPAPRAKPAPREDPAKKAREEALKREQEQQEAERLRMEEEERREEQELLRQQQESRDRIKALEEQAINDKAKKVDAAKKKSEANKAAEERKNRLAAMRAEIEKAKAEEERLRLESLKLDKEEESSSDDEGPQQITPTKEKPDESWNAPKVASPPAPVATQTETVAAAETNPFFRKLGSNGSTPSSSVTSPQPPAAEVSHNPFHKFAPPTAPPPKIPHGLNKDDDDWSVVSGDNGDSDDEEEEAGFGRQRAAALAESFFGNIAIAKAAPAATMSPTSPPTASFSSTSPPPAPPMPPMGAPPPPPPPPPPMMGGPPPPPPGPGPAPPAAGDRGALFAQIQGGARLRKTATKDRSQSSTAGRVLDS